MKKLCYISLVASPHQVRFIPYLRQYFDAEFYFYDQLAGRQEWWRIDLGLHGHLIPRVLKWRGKYFSLSVLSILRKEAPDILMLGTFSAPANILAYCWGRLHGCKIVVVTERSRILSNGEPRPYDWKWKLLHWIYRNVDIVMTVAEDIVPQFRDTFKFGEKVVGGQYPADLDKYYLHSLRGLKSVYTLIFPNRMTDIYNPLEAVLIFNEIHRRHSNIVLKMNSAGELRPQVESLINELGLKHSVCFLDGLKCWDDLGEVYQGCDIMILPAKYSNGNYTIVECAISGMACIFSNKILGESARTYARISPDDVIDISARSAFVNRVCFYLEHPEEISRNTERLRSAYRSCTMLGTAELYSKILAKL